MEQMIQALLGPQWAEWKAQVASQLNLDPDQAGGVLSGAASQVMGLYTQGQLDLAKLQTPAGVSGLLARLDLNAIAQTVGTDSAKLEGALGKVLPDLIQKTGSILGGGSGLGDILGNLNQNRPQS